MKKLIWGKPVLESFDSIESMECVACQGTGSAAGACKQSGGSARRACNPGGSAGRRCHATGGSAARWCTSGGAVRC